MSRRRRDFCPVLQREASPVCAAVTRMEEDMMRAAHSRTYAQVVFEAVEHALLHADAVVRVTFKNYGEAVLAGETIERTMLCTGPGVGFGVVGTLDQIRYREDLRCTEITFGNGSTVLLAVEQRQEAMSGAKEEG